MPTIQEITALRKAGRLDEALQAAESEFAQNANNYTAGALFWCLNVLYKKPEQDVQTIVERMQRLYEDYCPGDAYMTRALESARNPHYQEVNRAVEESKAGVNALRNYQSVERLFSNGQLAPSLFQKFGWLIYYALRHTDTSHVQLRKEMLCHYLQLNLAKPSLLHSSILREAIRTERDTPLQFRFRDFIRLWGLENLTDDDWQQYKTEEGNTLLSTVEKLIGVYAKELKTDNVAATEEFAALVDRALEKYPNSQNMPYFKATVLISLERRDEAVGYYRDLILCFPSKFYLWQQTAELVDDPNIKTGLLCKAVTSGGDEQFLGGVRLALAQQLIEAGEMESGRYELDRYHDLYQSRGWGVKTKYWELFNHVRNVTAAADNREIYSIYSRYADEFVYGTLPVLPAVKISERTINDRNRPGRKFTVWTLRTKYGHLTVKKPQKFKLTAKERAGVLFNIKLYARKVVWMQAVDTLPQSDWVKELAGSLHLRIDRNGRKYAIIGGAYVGEKLLEGRSEGETVKIVAVKQDDGRFSAVSLKKIN